MRVMLAKILLQQPDLLLLDEPTNHLDLPSIKWLEGYLSSFSGAFIIVSHDRYFLDRSVRKIVEAKNGKLTEYRSEEHTSELQSLMRISSAVFCLKKKNKKQKHLE